MTHHAEGSRGKTSMTTTHQEVTNEKKNCTVYLVMKYTNTTRKKENTPKETCDESPKKNNKKPKPRKVEVTYLAARAGKPFPNSLAFRISKNLHFRISLHGFVVFFYTNIKIEIEKTKCIKFHVFFFNSLSYNKMLTSKGLLPEKRRYINATKKSYLHSSLVSVQDIHGFSLC